MTPNRYPGANSTRPPTVHAAVDTGRPPAVSTHVVLGYRWSENTAVITLRCESRYPTELAGDNPCGQSVEAQGEYTRKGRTVGPDGYSPENTYERRPGQKSVHSSVRGTWQHPGRKTGNYPGSYPFIPGQSSRTGWAPVRQLSVSWDDALVAGCAPQWVSIAPQAGGAERVK